MRIAIALMVSLIAMQAQIPQPTDFDGWMNRGKALFLATGRNREAAEAFGRASNLDPMRRAPAVSGLRAHGDVLWRAVDRERCISSAWLRRTTKTRRRWLLWRL